MLGFGPKFNATDFPSDQWLKEANEECVRTPDVAKLMQAERRRIFVVDTMKANLSDYRNIAEHSAFLNTAYTDEKFSLYSYRYFDDEMKEQSLVLPIEDPKGFRIRGELHIMDSEHFIELDKIKDNGVQFLRKRVNLIRPLRAHYTRNHPFLDPNHVFISDEITTEIKAWMYVGNPAYWNDKIDGGFFFTKLDTFTPSKPRDWLDKYYYYVERNRPK